MRIMKLFSIYVLLLILIVAPCGCSILKEKEPDPTLDFLKRPITKEESGKLANEAGSNWLYGQGFGESVVALGGIILFPPYALYVLGNGAVSLSGYEPLYVTNLLPDKAKAGYNEFYDGVTSGPGRFSAAVAGEEYRTMGVVRERYQKLLQNGQKEVEEGKGR